MRNKTANTRLECPQDPRARGTAGYGKNRHDSGKAGKEVQNLSFRGFMFIGIEDQDIRIAVADQIFQLHMARRCHGDLQLGMRHIIQSGCERQRRCHYHAQPGVVTVYCCRGSFSCSFSIALAHADYFRAGRSPITSLSSRLSPPRIMVIFASSPGRSLASASWTVERSPVTWP